MIQRSIIPALFVGHGSPMNAIEDNEYNRAWREVGQKLSKPKAILCISAHWETRGVSVTASPHPETIYDFRGFPQELYDVTYPAPGHPALAKRTAELLNENVTLDPDRGFDHGVWSVLRVMFPQADIPVVQMSLDKNRTGTAHYELGKKLAPLRREGIMVMATGNIVHNLRLANFYDPAPFDWAQRFSDLVKKKISEGDFAALTEPYKLSPDAPLAVPTPEHYWPLLYVLAQRESDEPVSFFNDRTESAFSMLSVTIGV